jgi:hypothetical protein
MRHRDHGDRTEILFDTALQDRDVFLWNARCPWIQKRCGAAARRQVRIEGCLAMVTARWVQPDYTATHYNEALGVPDNVREVKTAYD